MQLFKYLRVQWDRTAAAASLALAGLCFLFGWVGVGHTPFTAQQLPYVVSGGLGGILFLTVAAVLWLSADLRDEWRKLDAIERYLEVTTGAATRNGQDTFTDVRAGRQPAGTVVR